MSKKRKWKPSRFWVHRVTGLWTWSWPPLPLGLRIETGKVWLVQTCGSRGFISRPFAVESVAMVPGYTNRLTVYGRTMYLRIPDVQVEVWLYPDGRRYFAIDRRQLVSVASVHYAATQLRVQNLLELGR
jgi:hypothetical protein